MAFYVSAHDPHECEPATPPELVAALDRAFDVRQMRPLHARASAPGGAHLIAVRRNAYASLAAAVASYVQSVRAERVPMLDMMAGLKTAVRRAAPYGDDDPDVWAFDACVEEWGIAEYERLDRVPRDLPRADVA